MAVESLLCEDGAIRLLEDGSFHLLESATAEIPQPIIPSGGGGFYPYAVPDWKPQTDGSLERLIIQESRRRSGEMLAILDFDLYVLTRMGRTRAI